MQMIKIITWSALFFTAPSAVATSEWWKWVFFTNKIKSKRTKNVERRRRWSLVVGKLHTKFNDVQSYFSQVLCSPPMSPACGCGHVVLWISVNLWLAGSLCMCASWPHPHPALSHSLQNFPIFMLCKWQQFFIGQSACKTPPTSRISPSQTHTSHVVSAAVVFCEVPSDNNFVFPCQAKRQARPTHANPQSGLLFRCHCLIAKIFCCLVDRKKNPLRHHPKRRALIRHFKKTPKAQLPQFITHMRCGTATKYLNGVQR